MKKVYLKTTKFSFEAEDGVDRKFNLGDWCYNLEQKLINKSDYYIFTEKDKEKKFRYLLSLKNKILNSLIDNLNSYHKLDKSFGYWNFLIGPWLIQFLHVLHDRWFAVEMINNKENFYTYICDVYEDEITPNEMHTAKHFYYQDIWNHYIFGEIIKYKKSISYELIETKNCNLNELISNKLNKKNFKQKIVDNFFKFASLLYSEKKKSKIIFSSDINYRFQIRTYIKFNQFPIFLKLPPKYISRKIDKNFRSKVIRFKIENDFENFLSKNFLKYLPKSLLENFQIIKKINFNFYKKFKSDNYFIPQFEISDQIKFFISEQENSKKFLYQHGGAYGILKYHYRELIEIETCDYYLTFGWDANNMQTALDKKNSEKIISFLPLHLREKKIDTKNNEKLYLILDEFPNYFYEYHSNIDAHTYRLYFQGIIDFISHLDGDVRKNLVVRLYPEQHHKDTSKILLNKFPGLNIDYGKEDIVKSLQKTKLCIIANNSTTFLSTLRIDVPTIVFWDRNVIEHRETCNDYFLSLYKAGIYYNNPKIAALFCNKNQDIYAWWNETERKNKTKKFLANFASDDKHKINKLYNLINEKKTN